MADIDLYFEYKCWKGLKERGLDQQEVYRKRLEYEISVIEKMQFPGYFLIVQDIINWAKNNDILVGPGRGSVAGSLVAYCLNITNLDPLRWDLLFERFLNPARVSMPDIDMDFEEAGRERVIQYVIDKYGADRVAHIGTFGQMKAKGAVKAAARTLAVNEGDDKLGDKISRLLLGTIHGKPQPIAESIDKIPDVKAMAESKSPEANVIRAAQQLENIIQSVGIHASGIVISNEPITNIVPLFKGKSDEVTTQWEMNNIEQVGLVKLDFLGLKTLSKIHMCTRLIKSRHGVSVDVDNLDLEDDKVYANLRAGNVQGVFQLETSSGMKDLLVRVRPTSLEDITALVAIFRPGPLQMDYKEVYLGVRAGQREPEYLVPQLKPILQNTSGWLIYQEQVLRIVQDLCGYTLAEADLMRRAIGKKKPEEMKKMEAGFLEGWIKKDLPKDKGEELWKLINEFANYAFNKSHAAAYALIAYQTAWLKTYYPHEWMLSVMTVDSGDTDQVIRYISECKRLEIKVLPPDINTSGKFFDLDDENNIRFGLAPIKNLGESVEAIFSERKARGNFNSFDDFLCRVDLGTINSLKVESLIRAGAFDSFGYSRSSLLAYVKAYWEYRKQKKAFDSKMDTYTRSRIKYDQRLRDIEQGKLSETGKPLKAFKEPVPPDVVEKPVILRVNEMSEEELLLKEHELLGFFVTAHPLDKYQDTISGEGLYTIDFIRQLFSDDNPDKPNKDAVVTIAAVPSSIKEITNKKKKNMAFIELEDLTGQMEAVVFSKQFERYKDDLIIGKPLKITGDIDITEGEDETDKIYRIRVSRVEPLILKRVRSETYEIEVPAEQLPAAAKVLCSYQGNGHRVKLVAVLQDGTKISPKNYYGVKEGRATLIKEVQRIK